MIFTENMEKTQSKKPHKVMVVFDDMIAGMLSNKKN